MSHTTFRGGLLLALALMAGSAAACTSAGVTVREVDDDGTTIGTCGCSITVNGESKAIACGAEACIGGTSYACGTGATLSESGNACAASGRAPGSPLASADAGTGTETGSTSAVSPSSAAVKDPPAAAGTTVACNSFSGSGATTCDATKEYCIHSVDREGDPIGGSVCAPLPKDCTGCGCLDVEADWKALNNGTNNCTAVPITCKNSSGAITAICVT